MDQPQIGHQSLAVSQGSVLGPVVFIIYINDKDVNNFIAKLADDTKI